MSKRTIITIQGEAFLIPEDQGKDLTGLVEKAGQWQKVHKGGYSDRAKWVVEETSKEGIEVSVVDDSFVKFPQPEGKEAVEA